MEYKDFPYQSSLAPYIRNFLEEKRNLGFIYDVMAYQLYRLDQYWITHGYQGVRMTPEMLDEWINALPGESRSSQNQRIGAARSLGCYLIAQGLNSYVPLIGVGQDHVVIHILSKDELRQLFTEIDNYVPKSINPADFRMANEYPIIFRLYYCCGMRNNEACALRVENIDLNTGIITILNGKNQRDRLVYLPDDLLELVRKYKQWLVRTLGYEPEWLFPGRSPDQHISKGNIDKRFKDLWFRTEASRNCEKAPTPHCLRHTYVVDRINSWILSGVDLNYMSSYLSNYLGHQDWDETFYYYHLVDDAFKIVQSKDTVSADVIPEVRRI